MKTDDFNIFSPHVNPNIRLTLADLEKIPRSLPCLIGWKDRESRYLGITDYMLEFSGLGPRDKLLSKCDREITRFEKFADYFMRCDRFAMDLQPLQIVEKSCNAKNELITVKTIKHPVYNTSYDKVVGSFFFSVPIEHSINATQDILSLLPNPQASIVLSGTHYIFELSKKRVELTKRESIVLYYYLRGRTSKQIADTLYLSSRTVEDYIITIKCKLNCNSRADVVDFVIFSGLFDFIPASLINNC